MIGINKAKASAVLAPLSLFALAPVPAAAKVAEVSERGFIVNHVAEVPATPEEVWALLIRPSAWWAADHTWSSDASNLTLDARAGGCFCEVLPGASKTAAPRGGVEHMRVIYVEKPRALRMSGVLGPLQGDAAVGTLTFQIKAGEGGNSTQILMQYVVGGFARTPFARIAPSVDSVLGAQLQSLSGRLGGTFAAAFGAEFGSEVGPGKGEAAKPGTSAEGAPSQDGGAGETGEGGVEGGVVPLSDKPPVTKGKVIGR